MRNGDGDEEEVEGGKSPETYEVNLRSFSLYGGLEYGRD